MGVSFFGFLGSHPQEWQVVILASLVSPPKGHTQKWQGLARCPSLPLFLTTKRGVPAKLASAPLFLFSATPKKGAPRTPPKKTRTPPPRRPAAGVSLASLARGADAGREPRRGRLQRCGAQGLGPSLHPGLGGRQNPSDEIGVGGGGGAEGGGRGGSKNGRCFMVVVGKHFSHLSHGQAKPG